jgi:hypothetical protein
MHRITSFFFLEYHPNVTETSQNKTFSVLFYLAVFPLSTIRCSLDKETHDTVMKNSNMGFSIPVLYLPL